FESETPVTDYYSRMISLFEREAHALYETEREIMLRTLPARNDTHPTFSMRMRANGVTEPNPFRTEPDSPYKKDVTAFLKDCDALRSQWDGWETARADYLETKQRIEAYEAKTARGEFPDELETKTYLCDTYRIAPEKALNATEELLEADGENLTASCVLGLLLCKRDDERGIRLICETAKKSMAAIELVEAAGDTVLRTGQQKLLDEFRADQVVILQNAIDETRSGLRARKFKPGYFCACDLPEARITAIKRVVTRLLCGNTEKAYLVKYAAPSGKPLYAIMIKPHKPVMQEYNDAIGELQDYMFGISDYAHRYILLSQKPNGSLLSAAERVGIPLLEN
ncbi:MAG: hypothetical protein K2H43_00560, partial [Clostridia bacterium]|nr:hypothetical protein [Clostridia bacterium]